MKVGIIGTGGMGGVHAKAYRNMPDVELLAFDRHADRLHRLADFAGAKPLESVDALIRAADVVDICLPTDMHEEIGLQAIGLGKAVFCEKPMARTLDAARRIIEAVSKAKTPFGVGQVVRFFPEFRRAHELVKSGAVGRPAAIRTHRGGSAPQGSDQWFMDHKRSGGVLIDLAIHDFDWLRWTFGEVKSVFARSVAASKGAGPDYALTLLTLDGGAVAHVESTWLDPAGFATAFEIAGSDGLLAYDSRRAASLTLCVEGKNSYEANLAATDDPYYQELRAFLDAFAGGKPAPVGPEEGFHALAISHAALESATTGQPAAPAPL
ncbi:MAG TPA: Gfo/Idh/MocA family oxidoreductase [Fimbriimonadaceae bacterium]|nr:Gfo/Idh/MocA family oxidoreductase [Fimbriimonadaceae bacterium]